MGTVRARGGWRVVVIAAALSLVVASPVGAQSPSPSATPVDGAALLEGALSALGATLSYRLENRATSSLTGDTELITSVVVVNSPGRAVHYQLAADGEVGLESVATLDGGWTRHLGGRWRSAEETGWSFGPLDAPIMALGTLDTLVSEGLVTDLVGPETIDGRDTLHYRARTIDPLITPPPDAYYRRTMTGTLDLWVDAAQGFLVRSELDMTERDGLAEGFGLDSIVMHEVAMVTDVDDPANVVETPDIDAPLATRPPGQGGDPALAPVVHGAFDALAAHDAYVITSTGRTMGSESRREVKVVNGPEPALASVFFAYEHEFIAEIQVGDRSWSRGGGEGPWAEATDGPTLCGEEPCSAAEYLGADGILAVADTFTLVGDGELLGGVPTLHVRSTAGAESPETGWVPGSVDLWIAKDGGHLLRIATDGQAIESVTTISRIDDPTIVIEVPSPIESPEP